MTDKNANRRIGQAGVMRVKAELMLRGFDVAEPDVDCGVDLIAWDHRGISRIQVKATIQNETRKGARFHTTKLVHKSEKSRQSYDPREVDFLVCVSIPLNQFWIIPSKNVSGKCKIYMAIGNDYHNKWHYLSQSRNGIGGDKFAKKRELTLLVGSLNKKIKELNKCLSGYRNREAIFEHKISNFFRFLRHDWSYQTIRNISEYATEHDREEWDKMLGESDVKYLEINRSRLESLYERLNSNPANGTQGDPAAGCPPSVYAS